MPLSPSFTIRVDLDPKQGKCYVTCPGNPWLADELGKFGGRFEPKGPRWAVDACNEARIRDVLRRIFGTDGGEQDMADLVTVLFPVHSTGRYARFGGRVVAARPARDRPVSLAAGVILVGGEFPASAGSIAKPRLMAPGSGHKPVVEIQAIPRAMLDVEEDNTYELVTE